MSENRPSSKLSEMFKTKLSENKFSQSKITSKQNDLPNINVKSSEDEFVEKLIKNKKYQLDLHDYDHFDSNKENIKSFGTQEDKKHDQHSAKDSFQLPQIHKDNLNNQSKNEDSFRS